MFDKRNKLSSQVDNEARKHFINKYGESQVSVFNDEYAFMVSEGYIYE